MQEAHRPIEDYALIGDCRAAALISREGSIDWLCLPHFDSPSVFAALLDTEKGGRFRIRPRDRYEVERRYVEGTAVLETTFRTEGGTVRLLDLMPVAAEREKARELSPDHHLLRILEGIDGEVEMEIEYMPRPDYGRWVPRLRSRPAIGLYCEWKGRVLLLRSEVSLHVEGADGRVLGTIGVRTGNRFRLAVAFSHGEPATVPALGEQSEAWLERTVRWWRAWSEQCVYQGRHRASVLRSAITLKLLTFAPSGAIVAAPTTSLPESFEGSRNWDYRFCWLRDASMTVQALIDLGYRKEGHAFVSWLLYSTGLSRPHLQVLYDVYGETKLSERQLPHLEGYGGAQPVRVGNAASKQFQLDTYGEVIDAVYEYIRRGGTIDGYTRRLLRSVALTVCRRWREPDDGIWEVRSGRHHHTHSKAMCWVALDRLLRLYRQDYIRVPARRLEREKRAIAKAIEEHGYDADAGTYVTSFDSNFVDASLLLLARYGYVDATCPRMMRTIARVWRELGVNGFLYRYRDWDDGIRQREGAFWVCSFWGVECDAGIGSLERAEAWFAKLLEHENDVGLLAEQVDVCTGHAKGNFPQAFSHLGLIDTALTLEERRAIRGTARRITRGTSRTDVR